MLTGLHNRRDVVEGRVAAILGVETRARPLVEGDFRLPVLGNPADIAEVLRRHRIETVILIPSELDGAEWQIRDACDRAGVPVKRMGRLVE